ncbi:MAG: calcium/sodium antiporter [Fibrobacteria bacterium]|nr:calcium/sodium antiporter [Fibrobacteria bacterium]
MVVVQILAGLAFLLVGGDLLVRWSSRLALGLGIPSLVVGLTVVSLGTSAPELAVGLVAAWNGAAEMAVGNVVGSNLFNVLAILGVSALVAPLVVSRSLVRRELPIMIGVVLLVPVVGWDGAISRTEGGLLVVAMAGLVWWMVRQGRAEAAAAEPDGEPVPQVSGKVILLLLLGIALSLVLLVAGSRFLVAGAVTIAQALGVSELVIGLTVVAVGTSLPELAASVVATFRGERDIAIGNVVGSNIFNVLCVLGGSGLLSSAPLPVPAEAMSFDIPLMIATMLLCVPVFLTHGHISRIEGILFLALYSGYTALLVAYGAGASTHGAPWLVLLLVLTLGVVAWEIRSSRRKVA